MSTTFDLCALCHTAEKTSENVKCRSPSTVVTAGTTMLSIYDRGIMGCIVVCCSCKFHIGK